MKNGCCRDCMRAFSKTGKSCLCQVPKFERKYTLPDNGCNFCGCHGNLFKIFIKVSSDLTHKKIYPLFIKIYLKLGCNPVDVRRDERKQRKRLLKDDKSIMYKNQRLLDSDDEDLKVFQR